METTIWALGYRVYPGTFKGLERSCGVLWLGWASVLCLGTRGSACALVGSQCMGIIYTDIRVWVCVRVLGCGREFGMRAEGL